ncbi:hypothetical protein KP509_39G019700 [Ceratopteris richardii]|nr:hypothetical protein KP509_39G019700 [Ceratopteris richardii]
MAISQNAMIGCLDLTVSPSSTHSKTLSKCRATYASSLYDNTKFGRRFFLNRSTVGRLGGKMGIPTRSRLPGTVVCGLELKDFIGGDLLGFDLDQWEEDVENHKAIAFYPPHEGGLEGRYVTRLKSQGYHFLNLTARGLGDVEAYLSKVHAVRPPHLGKQKIVRWYYPPEIDYRLSLLPENSKGLVLWLIEAKVLSKAELQYLAILPTLQPKVRVVAECGNW